MEFTGDYYARRLHDFDVNVTTVDGNSSLCFHYEGPFKSNQFYTGRCPNNGLKGRRVRVTNAANEVLTLCEVQVWTYDIGKFLVIPIGVFITSLDSIYF